jgi:hypothetical protein
MLAFIVVTLITVTLALQTRSLVRGIRAHMTRVMATRELHGYVTGHNAATHVEW